MNLLRRYTDTLAELFVIYVLVLIAGAVAFSCFEGRDFWTSLYWAAITAMSVGYGDVSPVTVGGRITAVVLAHAVLLGVLPLIIVRLHARVLEDRDAYTHDEQEAAKADLTQIRNQLQQLLDTR